MSRRDLARFRAVSWVAMAAMVVTAMVGITETLRNVAWARNLEEATSAQLFESGLISLQSSPYVPFLRTVSAKVKSERVYLALPQGGCGSGPGLNSGDAFAIAYAILPAEVTCTREQADFLLYFGLAPPAGAGTPVVAADAEHVMLRRTGA